MQEHEAALDTHVVVEPEAWNRLETIKRDIKRVLDEQFAIHHSTLEFEHADHAHQHADTYGHG
jgi:cobalt-zinc-cadmium efflux system protein